MTQPTVLITGSSTGIGRAAAEYFQQRGWNVAATMRTPAKETALTKLERVICPALDVTDAASIAQAVTETLERYGRIDALVNNAGYGLTGPFEGASEAQIRRQFDTNVFGLMAVTRAVLPHFRQRRSGTVINVASMGGRLTFPLYSVYHGTKWAVDGFSESLRFELEPLGIRVRIVEPGAIKTDFYERSNDSTLATAPAEYQDWARRALANMDSAGAKGLAPEKVAATIYRAATDTGARLRYPVGPDARSLLGLRRVLSDGAYAALVKMAVLK